MKFFTLSYSEETTETVNEYSNKSIVDFKLVVVYTSLTLTDQEEQIIATSFMNFSREQVI